MQANKLNCGVEGIKTFDKYQEKYNLMIKAKEASIYEKMFSQDIKFMDDARNFYELKDKPNNSSEFVIEASQ